MKRFSFLIFLFLISSCGYLASTEDKTNVLVNKELQEIDWAELDNYPLFDTCDETVSKALQRYCFEQEFLKYCAKTLQEFEFEFDTLANPKVSVDFVIDQDGRITDVKIEKDLAIEEQMPQFEQIISNGLKNMPALGPALKRGLPVKAKFRIPIVLSTTKEEGN